MANNFNFYILDERRLSKIHATMHLKICKFRTEFRCKYTRKKHTRPEQTIIIQGKKSQDKVISIIQKLQDRMWQKRKIIYTICERKLSKKKVSVIHLCAH